MSTDWLGTDRSDLAARRILDSAETLFVERGITAVSMRDIAGAAGCSRATLYRYFPGKAELLAAYVEREAARVAGDVARATAAVTDPPHRLCAAIGAALAGVRGNPALAAWFTADTAGNSARLAAVSPAIETMTRAFLHELEPRLGEHDRTERARWLVRVIVSLLTDPGSDPAAEERMLMRFVVPVILD